MHTESPTYATGYTWLWEKDPGLHCSDRTICGVVSKRERVAKWSRLLSPNRHFDPSCSGVGRNATHPRQPRGKMRTEEPTLPPTFLACLRYPDVVCGAVQFLLLHVVTLRDQRCCLARGPCIKWKDARHGVTKVPLRGGATSERTCPGPHHHRL